MTARRMTKTDLRRKAHRANATTYFQSNSDGMRLYCRGRRPDAFIRWLRKFERHGHDRGKVTEARS